MKPLYCVIVRTCSWLAGRTGALIIGLAVVWMASAPRPAWSQSAWPSYPNNNAISVTSGGNVGIGTTSPAWKLDVAGYSRLGGMSILTADSGYEWWTGSFTDFQSWQLTRRKISDGSWTNALTVTTGGNVGIGTTSPQYKLAVNGTIGAKEVIVTNTGWPDYVFRPGYRLRPLSEVNDYIQAHHHLPDIPSAAEVNEKGVSVGEMQAKLLAKIEELTLHMIQQDKENRELRERVAQLENRAAGSGAPAAGW